MNETSALGALVRAVPRTTSQSLRRVDDLCAGDDEGAQDLLAACRAWPEARLLLAGIQQGTGFLWRIVMRDPGRAARLIGEPAEASMARIVAIARDTETLTDEADAMRRLRLLRSEAALLIALADLGGVWSVERVTLALSDFADACVQGAFGYLLREAVREGRLAPGAGEDLTQGLGMFILALGKHGARELNYSSDIDLTIFFEPEAPAFAASRDPQDTAIRMVKKLVRLLNDRDSNGYVHRVDLRLRPDPGSTPIVMPVAWALGYYETVGQNWERAAMIKARPIAGDIPAGLAFLKELVPFVWRKYFDYAAISDIHAMKRQIYAVKGHERVAIAGHDLKVGRGGIREIEFFVQTQQLVYGGRRPGLRGSRTLDMLVALRDDGWITDKACDDLSEAYRYLRALEHRIQMVDDEQTQRLPSGEEDLARFSGLCGLTRKGFDKALTRRLLTVESHYARLFESMPGLASSAGSLVFTGVEDDPATLDTLRKLGFVRPEMVAETVRGWHFGRRAAVTTPRAREILTELVPALLEAFGNSSDPDAALLAFDQTLARLPAAVELFSILKNHPGVRGLFAEILGSAPRLAEVVSRAPHVLDAIVDPEFARPLDSDEIERRAGLRLAREPVFEVFLEQARTAARHEQFLVATQVLSAVVPATDAGAKHTAIAEALLRLVFDRLVAVLAEKHGKVPGARCAILGYGKLGSHEMTAASDLDLVIVYDAPPEAMSDGERPLYASEWFARLTQRLITALSAQLRNGALYEIDLRLRPSGRKGPVAVSFDAFRAYQSGEAETWEHMALSRARPVLGDRSFQDELSAVIAATVARPRDARKVAREIASMRALMAKEKAPAGRFDFKMMPGGLVDIEFVAQYLALTSAAEHPEVAQRNTLAILQAAGRCGLIGGDDLEILTEAWRLYTGLTQYLRIVLHDDRAVDEQPESFRRKLSQAAGLPAFKMLVAEIERRSREVRKAFERIVGPVRA